MMNDCAFGWRRVRKINEGRDGINRIEGVELILGKCAINVIASNDISRDVNKVGLEQVWQWGGMGTGFTFPISIPDSHIFTC
ncbi:hypothetical protein MTR_8g080780 [Medicago truncatula]|uniref:Uncharacterized protein n=1 Tax=Medicago truncatula TaxID=3880 RepID=A0A072TTU1_MEDTR|nr:hypothetical protein MTR_8g080780 [Medicago truncatula]